VPLPVVTGLPIFLRGFFMDFVLAQRQAKRKGGFRLGLWPGLFHSSIEKLNFSEFYAGCIGCDPRRRPAGNSSLTNRMAVVMIQTGACALQSSQRWLEEPQTRARSPVD
jgi:hypothetical protein